jgi:branched-chain amino acid transport system substrate-binding protein
MSFKKLCLGIAAAALLAVPTAAPALGDDEIYIPLLVYRTGPYAPSGIPLANGFGDYFKLVNAKGGLNGVKIVWDECETSYDTKLGVECYEKTKAAHGGAAVVNPYSTGITYALIPKAAGDKVVIHSMGYGRTDASDGRVFPWIFTLPTSYWSQTSAQVKYIAEQSGGMDKLKGKKITLVYHNSPYGKEPIPTLEALSKQYGYELSLLAVDHPGQEQKATWLQVRRQKPDWILLWGWGVMNQVSIKEAADMGFPMDHIIGSWWAGSEADVKPAGAAGKGYKAANFHGAGTNFALHKEILAKVHGGNEQAARAANWGEVLYNRGVINAVFNTEAIRTAQQKFGVKVPNSEQVRWGYEHLKLDEARLKELGLEDFTKPVALSCADHEGGGPVIFQQWDGEQWKVVSDWVAPMKEVVRPLVEASAAAFAKENNITPRDCSKEQ